MQYKYVHPAQQVADFMRRVYYQDMTTSSGGNITLVDGEGNRWVTPAAIDKAALQAHDILCIAPDGTMQAPHPISSEYPFHEAILDIRHDIKAVLHAHPKAIVGYSFIQGKPDFGIFPRYEEACGQVNVAEYGNPGTAHLGEKIAVEFRKGCDIAILSNHGIVVSGADMLQTFVRFELAELVARVSITARQTGLHPIPAKDPAANRKAEEKVSRMEEFSSPSPSARECAVRSLLCTWAKRAYRNHLCTTLDGSFSGRVDEHSFLVTPRGMDRSILRPEDMVLIRDNRKEAGKTPDDTAPLFAEIYAKKPNLNYGVMACPANIMVYGVTEKEFDVKIIPESYVMLRAMDKLPFGAWQNDPSLVADYVNENRPVLLLENDGFLSVGETEFKTFDRMEVAEYTARSLFDAESIGSIVPMTQEALRDIEKRILKMS